MTYQIPDFQHKEVENLYKYDLHIPKDILQSILDLPKESLTQDLLLLIRDAITNYEYFEQKEYVREENEMVLHAFCILAEIKAEDALSDILDILTIREETQALKALLSDFVLEELWLILYQLGSHQIDKFLPFVCKAEPIFWGLRNIPSIVVSRIALYQPERREECIQWFREVYERNVRQPEIFSEEYDYWGFWASNILYMHGVELLPEVKDIYKRDWIETFIAGTTEDIEQEILKPIILKPTKALFTNIFDYYQKALTSWFYYDDEKITQDEKKLANRKAEQQKAELERQEKKAKNIPYENKNVSYSALPIIKDPKIGRNDPCPCGSGKKYKKCCG